MLSTFRADFSCRIFVAVSLLPGLLKRMGEACLEPIARPRTRHKSPHFSLFHCFVETCFDGSFCPPLDFSRGELRLFCGGLARGLCVQTGQEPDSVFRSTRATSLRSLRSPHRLSSISRGLSVLAARCAPRSVRAFASLHGRRPPGPGQKVDTEKERCRETGPCRGRCAAPGCWAMAFRSDLCAGSCGSGKRTCAAVQMTLRGSTRCHGRGNSRACLTKYRPLKTPLSE